MRQYGRKGTALLLALVLVLGLAACGSRDGDKEQLSGTVYVPQFMDCKLDARYIYGGCVDGENVYIMGEVGEETETTDPDTGETYYTYDSHMEIYRIPLDGGEAVRLENYTPPQLPEGAEGSAGIQSVSPGPDGTIWVMEYLYSYTFDLPEDFNEETDDKWQYQNYQETTIRRQLDSTGGELARMDLGSLSERLEVDYINNMAFDADGNTYVSSDGKISVLDSQLNVLFTLEEENLWGSLTQLGDGSIGIVQSSYDEQTETSSNRLRTIDPAAQGWGTEFDLPLGAGNIYPGGGDYLFYYQNGDSTYGRKAGAEEGEKIFSWVDSDINRSDVAFFSFTPDGRVVVVTQNWGSGDSMDIELAVMTATDRASLPEKTTLTYAAMWLGYDMRNKIIKFNKTSDKYRIQVQDYSEFNTGEDNSAGLTRLNTELIAGNVPDILDTSSLPLRQYGARGLLEDLWPFIENDPELGRGAVMERVLQAGEQDGKLYQIFNGFYIQTVVGAASVVGDRMSWTLADLQDALSRMPEGCAIFGQTDTKDGMLSSVLSMNADSFVDWDSGECRFDSDSFKSLLEFCNSFPAEFDWENFDWNEYEDESARIAAGKQLLSQTGISDVKWGVTRQKVLFGGEISFIGYPMEDGSVGSSFAPSGTGLAMSASCKDKDGAWSFIRQEILPRSEEEFYSGQFYVNKSDFDKAVQQSMEPTYELDENGNPLLDENGDPIEIKDTLWISDEVQVDIPRPTQADYDQLMALYNAIDTMYYYDENIYDIVTDLAGGYFSGDRSLDETASQIQSRVKLYVNENR